MSRLGESRGAARRPLGAGLFLAGLFIPTSALAAVDVANSGTATVAWVNYVDGGTAPGPATLRASSQSFVTNYDLVSINACISLANRGPSTTDTVTVSVRANGTGNPGAVLASQTFATASSTTTRYCFPFTLSLSAGTAYHITVAGNLQPLQEGYHHGFIKQNVYAGGLFYNSTDGGTTWTANATWDAIFDITGELPPGTAPTLTAPYDYIADKYTEPLLSWTAPTAGAGPDHFKVEWATDPAFTTGLKSKASDVSAVGFSNAAPCTGPPYAVGCGTIRYKVQAADAMANGTTYWWRVSAGSGTTWRPSDKRSLSVDTTLVSRGWRQTTTPQFDGGTLTQLTSAADEVKLVSTGANHALLAAGSTVTATSTNGGDVPENAVDGDLASRWVSGQGPVTATQELVVNLGQSRVLQRINMESNGNATNVPKEYTFETSDAVAGPWTVRATNLAGGAFFEVVLAPTVAAQYVKMRITKSAGGGDNLLVVNELRAIGVPPATGSLVTPPIALTDFALPAWPDTFYVVTIPDGVATMKVTAQRFSGSWVDTATVDGPFTGPLTNSTRTLSTSALGAEPQLRFRVDYTAGSTGVLSSFTVGGSTAPLAAGPSLTAAWDDHTVRVSWETLSDGDVLGFDVLRALDPSGPGERMTGDSIPPSGDLVGASYEWIDDGVESRITYYYWLEERLLDGSSRLTGPVEASQPEPSGAGNPGCACSVPGSTPDAPSSLAPLLACSVFLLLRRRKNAPEAALHQAMQGSDGSGSS